MKSRSANEVRRCRPLLGTFVEITAGGPANAPLPAAVEAAFAVVERLQRLLSVHDPASEISLLNREALRRPVRVSPDTFTLLQRGLALAEASAGAFDFTIAPTLARWGLRDKSLARARAGDWRSVRLLRGARVRFTRPAALDLGGIAKGFAVDAAIDALRAAGVEAALVNAGGDVRVFGPRPFVIHLRHPVHPGWLPRALPLSNAALATSAPCFTQRRWRGQQVSHLVNPRGQRAVTGPISVTIRARECWLADALTKVVLNAPQRAERLLDQHEAEAFILTA